MNVDASRGYDAIVDQYIAARSKTGRTLVRKWAADLHTNSSIIDIGAGHGEPVTAELIAAGHSVWAIDASPEMVRAFQTRFPNVPVRCETVENSEFFGRNYDAALMVGLIFLLEEDLQMRVFECIRDALKPNGRLLFSAPEQEGQWQDLLTARTSWSLGFERYKSALSRANLLLVSTYEDEGGNFYYEARRN